MIIKVGQRVLYQTTPDDFEVYEITPTSSVRNNQTYVLAKVIAGLYRSTLERRTWGEGALLTITPQYRFNFRIVLTAAAIKFYMIAHKEKAAEVIRKAESIYDSGITVRKVDPPQGLNPGKTFCTELAYRKHDAFSLATDKDNNYPLPSLLTTVRTLEEGDVAVFDAMLEPYNRMAWYTEAKQAHNLLEKGYVPDNSGTNKVLRLIHEAFNMLRYELLKLTRFTKAQKQALEKWKKEESSYREAARIRDEMTNSTKRKQDEDVLRTWLRVAVQSDDEARARDAAYTIANSWKDISSDNELERHDVPAKWTAKYVEAIEQRKGFTIRFKQNKLSTGEVGKLLQLPGKQLIEDFPQIVAQKMKEVSLPDELTQEGIKTVRLGHVTERGVRKLARIPLEAYGDIKQKAVYDALCTASFGQGKQGSGKSEGFGTTWAYDMVTAGFTVIIMDTADGQVLRDFVDCLPADFPDHKVHALNFDNKAYPVPLDWADVYGRNFNKTTGGDEELAALEIAERVTSRFLGFIDSLSRTGDFTDRMKQYVTSCMRAITTRPGWSFLDLELALTSPAYREELLQIDDVKALPDVVRDLRSLQGKTAEGKEGSIVDPILSRLKVLSSTQFMANLFYQEPKLQENGKPVLDLRKLMDNPEGGYGHVIALQASGDAWQEHQATILGFFEDKINFNAFSRIDTNQADRKPCLKWIDEPHKVVKALEGRVAGTSVEFRKYRIKNLFTGHSIDQMGTAADALLDGGAQITSYKTERLSELSRFAHNFKPYHKAQELYDALPEKHTAINAVRLPSGKSCPAFIADMVAPPGRVKDRSHLWQASAKRYGRPWKEVRDRIQLLRNKYQELDSEWLQQIEEAKKEARDAEKKGPKSRQ